MLVSHLQVCRVIWSTPTLGDNMIDIHFFVLDVFTTNTTNAVVTFVECPSLFLVFAIRVHLSPCHCQQIWLTRFPGCAIVRRLSRHAIDRSADSGARSLHPLVTVRPPALP